MHATKRPSVSVIVPARNEAGNIRGYLRAHAPTWANAQNWFLSKAIHEDNTYAAIEAAIAAHPERCCQLIRQDRGGQR